MPAATFQPYKYARAVNHSELSSPLRNVLRTLTSLAFVDAPTVRIRLGVLAEYVGGVAVRTIRKHVAELERRGWLVIHRRSGRASSFELRQPQRFEGTTEGARAEAVVASQPRILRSAPPPQKDPTHIEKTERKDRLSAEARASAREPGAARPESETVRTELARIGEPVTPTQALALLETVEKASHPSPLAYIVRRARELKRRGFRAPMILRFTAEDAATDARAVQPPPPTPAAPKLDAVPESDWPDWLPRTGYQWTRAEIEEMAAMRGGDDA